jgi:methionyl-tRNA formyltransferase
LGQIARDADLVHAASFDQLIEAIDCNPQDTRLLAFCTAVIVPSHLLDRLPGPSYNIHPGPPNYPGRHPESWGAYDGVAQFGATLHEMAPRVDEGAIIDVEWTDIPPDSGQTGVGLAAFRAALRVFARWANRLLHDAAPLPRSSHVWSGRKTTHAQLEAMCRVTPDISEIEFERRRRSFAEQAGSRMSVKLHGREFYYTAAGAP